VEEHALIALAKEGDQEAFAQLVEQNQTKVYNLALRLTGSPEDAADLSQEAFLNAWRGLASFQGESAFSTWLYRLTNNVCIDFLRREARRKSVTAPLSLDDDEIDLTNFIPDRAPTPQQLVERKELNEGIARGLEQLSLEHRQVLVLREVTGLSYAEIAQALSLEEGTVKSRIARARLALRKLLLEQGNFSAPVSSESLKRKRGDGI